MSLTKSARRSRPSILVDVPPTSRRIAIRISARSRTALSYTAAVPDANMRASRFPSLGSIALLAALSGSAGCDLCGNEVLARYRAADNSVEVVVFERSCGATTGFSTQASIQEINAATLNEAGNIFAATTDRGATPSGKGGGPELRVRWLDAQTLELAHHKRASVSYGRTSFRGITIRYVTFE
jgi:hypothetical protein